MPGPAFVTCHKTLMIVLGSLLCAFEKVQEYRWVMKRGGENHHPMKKVCSSTGGGSSSYLWYVMSALRSALYPVTTRGGVSGFGV